MPISGPSGPSGPGGPQPVGHAEALAVLREAISELPHKELPALIERLAGLQALAFLRAVQAPEPEGGGVFVPAAVAAKVLGIPRRTLYDRAPGLTWARKTGPRRWEFLLSGVQAEKRRREGP